MKERGKAVETFNGGDACFSSDMPCKKHPCSSSSSSGDGICAFCLRERLFELVCQECGEQRLSSCSCSENSSDPNSNGEIGRISFLLENEKSDLAKNLGPPKTGEPEIFKRSNSSCVADVTHRRGFWKIGRLFRKRAAHKSGFEKNEMCVSDLVGVPRSRSLCSFRGGGNGGNSSSLFYDTEESSGGVIHSAARVSSVSGGFMMDSAKRSCFSESEARISNFDRRISNVEYEKDLISKGIFTMREEYEFSSSEDPKFIDLKLDLSSSSSEIRTEHSVLKRNGLLATKEFGYGSMRSNDYDCMFKNGGGACRFSVTERDLKKCRKSRKVWRWFFRDKCKAQNQEQYHNNHF